MSNINKIDKALLYPQTFLFPDLGEKILPFLSNLVILQLSSTGEIWEKFYSSSDWQKIKFLNFKDDLKIDWEELEKEKKILEDWGLNFRTPENLKYFSQFKEILEDNLENIFSAIKGKKENSGEDEIKIKKSLITLLLAEDLDVKLYDVYLALKAIDEKYKKIFDEKIIGEDLTFHKILDTQYYISESYLSFNSLLGLFPRINAWKSIGNYLKWEIYPDLNNLVITDAELLEKWKDKFEFKKEKINQHIDFYKFRASLFQVLEMPVNIINSRETGVFILNS